MKKPERGNKYKPFWLAGWVAIALVVGFCAGYALKPEVQVVSSQSIRENTTAYKFIHPLLAVGRPDISTPSPQYLALANSVKAEILKEAQSGAITSASVYFINYGKSGSFAINEAEPYAPASLLKVVILVAYLKQSETDSSILANRLVFTPAIAAQEASVPYESPTTLAIGGEYDVSSLIDKMIIDSDNGAMNLLLSNINDAYLSDVYTELGLRGPGNDPAAYTISAKDYSLFFRILYNGTYLSSTNSEKALSILSRAAFKDGLVAGMPEGTLVAHKFGEHVNGSGGSINSVELHDCGIIYVPGGPYLLCVMTKGKAIGGLESTISSISKLVYEAVTKK